MEILHVRLTTIDHRDTIATFNADSLHCRKNENGTFTKKNIQPMNVEMNQIKEGKKIGAIYVDFFPSQFLRFPILISHYSFHI